MTIIDSGMGWAIFGAAFVFIFILLGILAESQRQKRKLQRQELLQKERFMAIEKGLPMPEWDTAILDEDGAPVSSLEAYERRREWFRLVSLCIGLILLFGGIGMTIAFQLAPYGSWDDIETVGAIPAMAGVGLLLFHVLSRPRSE
jgi:O-antigen/teichoic acid export membrane protein